MSRLRYLPAVLADGMAVFAYASVVGPLSRQFEVEHVLNAVILGASYLGVCGSVLLLRKLEPATTYGDGWTYLLIAIGLAYAVYVIAMAAESSGLLRTLEDMDSSLESGRDNAILAGGTFGGFALLLLFPAAMLVSPGKPVRAGSGVFLALETVAFLASGFAVIVAMAHWEALFADVEPYESVTLGAKLLIFATTLLFFLMFYGSPRLLFLLRDRSWLTIATFLGEVGTITWLGLDRTAW